MQPTRFRNYPFRFDRFAKSDLFLAPGALFGHCIRSGSVEDSVYDITRLANSRSQTIKEADMARVLNRRTPEQILMEMDNLLSELKEIEAADSVVSTNDNSLENEVWNTPLAWASSVYKARRLRDAIFGPDMFADAQWDLLLDLYRSRLSGRRVQVSSACIAAAVPPTTALRHIHEMQERGMILRNQCSHDNRRTYVSLSDEAVSKMNQLYERQRAEAHKPQ